MKIKKITVIGAGSWGTSLALLLSEKGIPTKLWGHSQEHIEQLQTNRENRRYLKGFRFPEKLIPTVTINEAVKDADIICIVVPSHVYRETFSKILEGISPTEERTPIFVSATKGVEIQSMATMNQIMVQTMEKFDFSYKTAVLSGPSFAREVACHVPTAITIGSDHQETAVLLQHIFRTDYFRVYTSNDVVGLETSAALKNIIAIAAGICDGLNYGHNARAALITRGLVEMVRFGKYFGAQEKTFYGLSGLGDLVLTCTGALSRNRHVGIELGKGKSLDSILADMSMIAEGVKTTKSVYNLSKRENIDMPILEQVYKILYNNQNPNKAVQDLLARDLKEE